MECGCEKSRDFSRRQSYGDHMDPIESLQAWYAGQCDGDWEREFGVQINTLDNPGWSVEINLANTELQNRPFKSIKADESDARWMHCFVRDDIWHELGDETKLRQLLFEFTKWASCTCGNA
jgi:Immunity protein 53